MAPRMIAKCKKDRQVHATFLKQNDFLYSVCQMAYFSCSINVNKNENTNHFL